MARTAPAIPMQVLEHAAATLRVLAHPHRLKITELLVTGRLSVGELADKLDLPAPAVSQHLNHMRAHRILACERQGRSAYYRVINPSATMLIECIRKHGGVR